MGNISSTLLPIAIGIIMFSLGVGLTLKDFQRVLKQPRDFFIGLTSQIILLPIVAFIIIYFFPLSSPELAVGVMIIAAAPGGATSNLFTSLAKGDVALSISLTAITSLISVITIPIISIYFYNYYMGEKIDVDVTKKCLELFAIVAVPTLIGMVFRKFFEKITLNIENIVKIISAILLSLVIIFAIFKYQDEVLKYFKQAGLITLLLNIIMMLIAFYIARLFVTGIKQGRCITLECGLQNGTIAIFVAEEIFKGEAFIIPAATYSLIMFATSLIFVYLVRKKLI